MHSFSVNIRISQSLGGDVHLGFAQVNIPILGLTKNSKWVWSGNTTITNCRQHFGTAARKSRSTITRYQEDKISKATSSLFPIKMIAILERTQILILNSKECININVTKCIIRGTAFVKSHKCSALGMDQPILILMPFWGIVTHLRLSVRVVWNEGSKGRMSLNYNIMITPEVTPLNSPNMFQRCQITTFSLPR